MIHTIRTVAVGDQESKIDSPIILYRGDREVEVEFTINGSKFTFTNGGNVIKSTNATHGQLVINTPTGENMFSEVTECHDGKVVFVITKEMIDELIEVGFYSFQIRLFDESQVSRVTIPPVLKGIDIRNPIAAEDETNVVDIGLVDYAVVVKDEFEDLSTFLPDGNYNKTNWGSKDIISGAKLNKIEDALYSINGNMEATDLALLNRVENINKTIHGEIDKLGNELESEVEEFERGFNINVEKFKIDTNAAMSDFKNEVSDELKHNEELLSGICINVKAFGAIGDGKTDDTNSIKLAVNYCSNNGGGTVFLPAGEYAITSSLNLPWGVNLIGVYERSCISPKFDTDYALILNGRHHVENIKFYYEDNNVSMTTTPKVFPASIYSNNLGYSVLRNIGLGNAYVGIYLKTISGGCSIENIYGYPLKTGIYIEHCIDVTPISRVHFNPNFYGVPKLELRKYVFENAEAVRIGRLDFSNVDRVFAWGYKTLFTLTDSPNGGAANNIKFTNWIADACQSLCIFEHHDGGISFMNGTGTFYNPLEAEEIKNGITPTSLGNFVITIANGGNTTWGGSLVSLINNRIYRCEKHFLRTYNPVIFIGNEITGYANSYSEDSTTIIDCLQINAGADNSIIQGNYINGRNKAQNRNIVLNGVSNVTVTGNILLGYKAISIYDNTKNNIIMFNNSDNSINTKGSFLLNNKVILGEFIGWNPNKLYLNIYSNSGVESISYSEGIRIGGSVQVREGDITPTSSNQNIGTGNSKWNNGIFNGVVKVGYGSTSNRPTDVESGSMWFDSTLGKPIWKNGSNWVDASGARV